MGFQAEWKENNMAVITVIVPQAEFQKAAIAACSREKGKYQAQDFRRDHVPRAVIEKSYGQGVFFGSAINNCINDIYPEAARESGLAIVSRPGINTAEIGMDKDLVYTAMVAVKPEVELGQYKGVEVQKVDVAMTDEDLSEALQREFERNARLVVVGDRTTEMGGNVKIDFDGSIDSVHSNGGKGENYPLVLGGGGFIDGFEEQVVGHKTGDNFDVSMIFPTEYHAKGFAGKEAVFACKLLEVWGKDLPGLNDKFASKILQFETLDECKADLRKQLEEAKAKSAVVQNEGNVVGKVVKNAELALLAPMIEMQCEQIFDDYTHRMQSQGLPLEQYPQYTDMAVEKLKEQFRPQTERNLKTRLVLKEVVKTEDTAVSEETIDAEIAEMAEAYRIAPKRMGEYVSAEQREELATDPEIQKAVGFLIAEAKLQ